MRNGKIVLASLMSATTLAVCLQASAEVNHYDTTWPNLVTFVSNDDWQPENFDNGTAIEVPHIIDAEISLDGKTDEIQWRSASEVTVPLSFGSISEVSLKALYTDKEIFLAVRWPDSTKDSEHHPWAWDADLQSYKEGSQVEDSVMLSFEAGCEWTPSLLSGYVYDFDGWHWLAARSDPLGQALDLYGNTRNREIHNTNFGGHQPRYQEDQWALKFTENRLVDMGADWHELDRMYLKQPAYEQIYVKAVPDGRHTPPYFELLPPPSTEPVNDGETYTQYKPLRLYGDAGEVSAKGYWEDGYWTVEFRRDLETPVGTIHDTVFNRLVQFSVHVFDHTDQLNEVSESGRLFLKFKTPKQMLVGK